MPFSIINENRIQPTKLILTDDENNKFDIEIGKKYRIRFTQSDNPNNKTIHILAIVDDYAVAFKFWSSYKKRWIYNIESVCFFEVLWEDGFLYSDNISNKSHLAVSEIVQDNNI